MIRAFPTHVTLFFPLVLPLLPPKFKRRRVRRGEPLLGFLPYSLFHLFAAPHGMISLKRAPQAKTGSDSSVLIATVPLWERAKRNSDLLIQQAKLSCLLGRLYPIVHSQLGEDLADMPFDGIGSNHQFLGNVLVGYSLC
jgi:hypothetical protein